MTIKNSGFIPNNISSLYPNSSRKLDQPTAIQNKTSPADVDKSCNFNTSNVDTIELSQQRVGNRASLSKARDQVVSDLNKDTDVSFLDQLKSQINSNQYKVDPQTLAKIMLDSDK